MSSIERGSREPESRPKKVRVIFYGDRHFLHIDTSEGPDLAMKLCSAVTLVLPAMAMAFAPSASTVRVAHVRFLVTVKKCFLTWSSMPCNAHYYVR